MFVEKRKSGENTKYYLSHKFRDGKKVKSIRKYLGLNLSPEELEKLSKEAEKYILSQIEELKTEIFNFALTKNQIEQLNKYDSKIKISHLTKDQWKTFQEDFVFNTNAIEGSTVLENEVRNILEKKHEAKTSDEKETIGLSLAVDCIRETKEDLSLGLILKLHKLCFEETKSFAGKFRDDVEVVIKNSLGDIVHRGAPKELVLSEMEELITWYEEHKTFFKPLVLAAIVHNQFEHIHPFQDGNGRIGRLLLNFILIRNNYPPINIFLENRGEYYNTLKLYSDSEEIKPTLRFLISQYGKMIKKVTTK
ncbi:MAG: Fic family protein [Candidatus Woesearchaeota archaeon]|jgi:Fic family protein|nr:Fic family protein [Candidatus Woesearchaeota archaeon]